MASLVIFLVAVFAAALFGTQFAPGAWYAGIDKAPWTPPNWLFGPAWTVLYVLIAVAGWRVWRATGDARTPLLGLWVAQLALNAAWSWLFFGLHRTGWALADISLMLVAILAFIVIAWRFDRAAAWLFVPYALWVAYASSLNAWVWLRNPAG